MERVGISCRVIILEVDGQWYISRERERGTAGAHRKRVGGVVFRDKMAHRRIVGRKELLGGALFAL